MKYQTRCKETGDYIDDFTTKEEAENAIKEYEEQDKRDGTFMNDFYEVWEGENCNHSFIPMNNDGVNICRYCGKEDE